MTFRLPSTTTSRVNKFLLFLFFLSLLNFFYCTIGSYKTVRGSRHIASWTLGPNDTSASFGPFSKFFFSLLIFFSNLINTYRLYQYIKGQKRSDGTVIMGNSPNDTFASFGPFSKFFFSLFVFFFNLINTYRLYRYIKGWKRSDGMAIIGNGPNNAKASFGPFSKFFFFFIRFFSKLN